jgi:hypothetical protein
MDEEDFPLEMLKTATSGRNDKHVARSEARRRIRHGGVFEYLFHGERCKVTSSLCLFEAADRRHQVQRWSKPRPSDCRIRVRKLLISQGYAPLICSAASPKRTSAAFITLTKKGSPASEPLPPHPGEGDSCDRRGDFHEMPQDQYASTKGHQDCDRELTVS